MADAPFPRYDYRRMLSAASEFLGRLDQVYRDRPYFTGIKARLLSGVILLILIFVPFNLVKIAWFQPPEIPLRLALNIGWLLFALLALRWLLQGKLERAGNGLSIGVILPVNLVALLTEYYPQPAGAALQLFVFNFGTLLMALVFASRRVALCLLTVIVSASLAIYMISTWDQPVHGSLQYAMDTLLRDGLISIGFLFCFGALLVSMIESAHRRSEEALRETRVLNENLERLVHVRTQDLEAATKRANQASRAKGDFLANMSHEIRTPLNGIIATADLLHRRTDLSSSANEQAALIVKSGDLLMKLINDVLDLSKIEAGQLVLDNQPFDLGHLVRDSIALLDTAATRAGVRLSHTLKSGPSIRFQGDGFRLKQVLLNLGSNAVKFTPEGGEVQLSILVEEPVDGRAEIHFEMRDSGIGMDEAALKRVFERFMQADSSTTRRYGGTGLGLAISSRIVTAMGGGLKVESRPGAGSTFSFVVRLAVAEPVMDMNDLPLPTIRSLGLRILVAEDNAVNRKILQAQLKQLGCDCVLAADGVEALAMLQQEPLPHAILMDCHMPKLDGWNATRTLRGWATATQVTPIQRRAASLPVIALTAAALPEERIRCLESGMNEFVAKPARLADLQGALESIAMEPVQPSEPLSDSQMA